MNKTQLVDALAARLGDRRTAAAAVDGVLEIIVDTVRAGGTVTIPGFGVFEGRARAARVGRNPRTGQPVDVPATTVPAFRPGTGFKEAVGGSVPAASPARTGTVSAVVAEPSAPFAEKEPKADKAGKPGKPGKAGKSAKGPKGKADKPKKGKPKK